MPLARAVADAARPMTDLDDVRALVAEAIGSGRCDLAALLAELDAGPVAGSRLCRTALRELGGRPADGRGGRTEAAPGSVRDDAFVRGGLGGSPPRAGRAFDCAGVSLALAR